MSIGREKNCAKLLTAPYHFSEAKALEIYTTACESIGVMPKTETTLLLITKSVSQLAANSTVLAEIKKEMLRLAKSLLEYLVVQKMQDTRPMLWPQLIANIGDVRRFHS